MVSKERLKCLLCEDDEQEGRALGHQKAGDPWLPPSKWTCKDDADDDDGMAPLTKKTTGYDIKTTHLNGKRRRFRKGKLALVFEEANRIWSSFRRT